MSETSQVSETSSDNEKGKRPRGSRKRQVHNEVERRRKDKINGWISKIGELLPSKDVHKQSKISILEQTVDYIKLLASEREKLLSENRSEVQAEEVKQLQKDLKLVQEQNAVYEKLLQQANISLNTLPKKALKYSDRFEKRNGVLTVKNSDLNINFRADSAIQVSSDLAHIYDVNSVSSLTTVPTDNPLKKTNVVKKNKAIAKKSIKAKTISPAPLCISSTPAVQTITCTVDSSSTIHAVSLGGNASQGNAVLNIACSNPANSASIHAGGVTTALSQFPLMSTTHGSSLVDMCNKNMSTIIFPSGGGILQHFPTAEKPSNTISIICPNTLPIIVPQQMFNVSSVTRNIGLSSTVFCPGPINDPCSQTDKSALGNTLFVINPNSVVPISSNISTSSRIILPQQAAVVGNDNLIPTVISATINPVPPTTSEQATVPLQPKPQADKSSEKMVQSSEISGSIVSAQNNSSNDRSSSTIHTDNTVSSLTSESPGEVSTVAEACNVPVSSENVVVPKAFNSGKLNKAPSPIRRVRNIHHNSLPSLQVLSANKIISLANQSQKVKSSLPLPLLSKDSVQTPSSVSLLQNANKSLESSNNFCLQIDTPHVPTHLNGDVKCATGNQNAPVTSMQNKSNFSLTVLMGNSSNDKKDSSSSKISNISQSQNLSQANTIVSAIQSNNTIKDNATSSSAALVTSLAHSTIPTSSIAVAMVNNGHTMISSMAPINTSYTIHNTMVNVGSSKVSDSSKDMQKSPNCAKSVELNGEVSLSTNSSLNCDNSNANMSVLGSSTNMTTTVASNTLTTVHSSLQFLNVCSKSSLAANKDPSIVQKQAGYKHAPGIENSVDVSNNAFSEPYGMIHTVLNQNVMPSLFSTNQIVSLNSSGFMCPGQETVASSIDLHNVRVSSEASHTTAVSCGISSSDNPSFNMLNKDNMHSGTFSMLSVSNESSKRPNESETAVLDRTVSNFSEKINVQESQKPGKATVSNEPQKQSPNSKKRKNGQKACKPSSKDMQTLCNTNDIVEINTNYELNKSQSNENPDSFSKQDHSDCLPQEFSNSMFTSDILARATESIFDNDMLDSPHAPKEAIIYYTDNNPHISVPVSLPNKQNSSSYKFHCISNRAHLDTTTNVQSINSKKSLGTNHSFSANLSNQTNHPNSQDQLHQKQSKTFKGRKSKINLDLEPPLKKLKENSDQSIKSTLNQNFENPNQSNDKNSIPSTQPIISSEPKQTLTESNVPEADNSVMDSISHFGNQIHIPESNCKTPTSVDAIFSLTPMLGDILKDVSHGMGVENRNGYLSCNDNQALFPGEKHFLSLNFTNSNEEYLNLPRMHFPVSSEMPAAPLPPTTNVSFVHTMSLCSTQSDNSKTTETISSTDPQNKTEAKKNSLCNSPSLHNHNLAVGNTMAKSSSEFLSKLNNPEPSFSIASKVSNASSSALFDNQAPTIQTSSSNISHTANSIMQQTDSRFSRDSFASSSHNVTFYPPLSSSTNHQSFVPSTSSSLPHTSFHHNSSANLANLSFPIQTVCSGTNTTYHSTVPKVDSLSHSLCSLLKETSSILVDNRTGNNGSTSQNMSTSANISQSKYSALSLISDHTSYSEPPTSSACHPEYVHSSVVCTPAVSDAQFTPVNPCGRNQRSSLSYSAESLLQTSCASSEKNKNKNTMNNRYAQRTVEKKSERSNIANMHGISDTNIFMPVSSCDISIQNAPLVPLPPVTSFHNFSSTYTLCDTVPSTTIFNSVSRPHEIPLSLSNENFLNHMNLSVESQMLGNRHDASTVPKPHTNINLPFESHGPLYNNCNFLPHVKSTIETSRASESTPCFPPTSFSNNYPQSTQKANCCHFPHRNLPSNAEHPVDISLSVGPPVPPFHSEKPNFQANRPSLQPTFSQANTNFVGNLFYSSSRDNMNSKPSNITSSQELFVPEGPRQNLHDHNPIYPNRKAAPSNRSKSKKGKSVNINEGNVNMIANNISNFPVPQDPTCNKPNISCIPNGYFKNNAHTVLPPPPSQLPCSQHKISENTNTVIPPNPPFNPVLHQQGDNFFNLNFQPSNFTMSPLPRPPTQPLSCSCLTTPIISHTFSSTNHPVPNFNLSNILPDMGCSGNQIPLPPVKFPPVNHGIQSSTAQCQTNSTISNSAHIISHQTCAPALYPPHPPIVRGSLNPILSHNPQFSDNQVPLVGTGATPVLPHNATFAPTQNPPFRNVIHSLSFPRNER